MSRLTKENEKYGGNLTQGMKIYNKLFDIEDFEDSLSIDLITLFKAIYKGIYFDCEDFKKNFTSRPRLYYSDSFKCYCFEISFGSWIVKLKDYKKTWWLKEDLENGEKCE